MHKDATLSKNTGTSLFFDSPMSDKDFSTVRMWIIS